MENTLLLLNWTFRFFFFIHILCGVLRIFLRVAEMLNYIDDESCEERKLQSIRTEVMAVKPKKKCLFSGHCRFIRLFGVDLHTIRTFLRRLIHSRFASSQTMHFLPNDRQR